MTKADIINIVSDNTGVDKSDVHIIFDGICDSIKCALALGESIQIRGFGSFSNKKRAKKVARNISKNTSIIIEPHYVPHFKPAKSFIEIIKGSKCLDL